MMKRLRPTLALALALAACAHELPKAPAERALAPLYFEIGVRHAAELRPILALRPRVREGLRLVSVSSGALGTAIRLGEESIRYSAGEAPGLDLFGYTLEGPQGAVLVGQIRVAVLPPTANAQQERLPLAQPVLFADGSERLLRASYPVLDAVAKRILTTPEFTRVELAYHYALGEDSALAERRANMARLYLVALGLAPERLTAVARPTDGAVGLSVTPVEIETTVSIARWR